MNKVGEECPVDNWTIATSAAIGEANHLIFTDAKYTNSAAADTSVVKKGSVRFLTNGNIGGIAGLGNDFAANTWMLFPVEKMEGTAYLFDALNELFPNSDPNIYNPGTEPGQISQALYEELIGSYEDAVKLIEEGTADHATCVAAYQRCRKALEAARAGAVPVKDGYYFFKSSRTANNGTYDDGKALHWTYQKQWFAPQERPEGQQQMTLDDTQYVWHIQSNKEANDGSFYIQNFYTKRYVGTAKNRGEAIKTTETAEESFLIYPQDKEDFVIESVSRKEDPLVGYPNEGSPLLTALHCQKDANGVVIWTTDAPASGWVFLNANADDIKRLEGLIAQDKLNKALATELTTAETTYKKGFYYDFVGGSRDGKLDMEGDAPARSLEVC